MLAKEFKLANSISHKADAQLSAAMEENAILKTLVTVNCKKNMTEKALCWQHRLCRQKKF